MSAQQTDQQRQAEREEVLAKAHRAKEVAPVIAALPTPAKDEVLLAAAAALTERARGKSSTPTPATWSKAAKTDWRSQCWTGWRSTKNASTA